MEDCLFCKIIAGEIPSNKVGESKNFFAFLDIAPVQDGHTLIVPKQHATTLLDMNEAHGNELLDLSQRIGRALIEELQADGFNYTMNIGEAAGQEVMHAHFHLIPRKSADGLGNWPRLPEDTRQHLADVAQKVRKHV